MHNLKNFRIKKVTDEDTTKYYPQEKWFELFWVNSFGFEHYSDGSFNTFEEAQKALCDYLMEPVVEYLEVDCGGHSLNWHKGTPQMPVDAL